MSLVLVQDEETEKVGEVEKKKTGAVVVSVMVKAVVAVVETTTIPTLLKTRTTLIVRAELHDETSVRVYVDSRHAASLNSCVHETETDS